MIRSPRETAATVRGAALSNFAEVARQVGVDPRRALRESGLDWSLLSEPDRRAPAAAVVACLEYAARESGCQTIGLRMAEARRLSDFGAVSLLIAHQATIRNALESLVRYRRLMNEALVMRLEDAGDLAIVREELVLETGGPARQAYELAVGALFRMFATVLGPRWRPYAICFTHAAPNDLAVHRRVFGYDVRFGGDFNGIVCWNEDLDRPNASADPALAEYARRYVDALAHPDEEPTPAVVQKAIHLLLPVGRASIAQVAQWLGLNVRTVQRRLAVEGQPFSDILNGARRDLARRYLTGTALSATDISRLLGYDQPSSFTRWFTAEFGVPPTRWASPEVRADSGEG
jgi:AraC-like DNA-binding protein